MALTAPHPSSHPGLYLPYSDSVSRTVPIPARQHHRRLAPRLPLEPTSPASSPTQSTPVGYTAASGQLALGGMIVAAEVPNKDYFKVNKGGFTEVSARGASVMCAQGHAAEVLLMSAG